jgi:serine/threonine protein kinase
MENIGCGA